MLCDCDCDCASDYCRQNGWATGFPYKHVQACSPPDLYDFCTYQDYTLHWSHADQSGKIGASPAGLLAPNALLDLTQTVLVSERAGACDWRCLMTSCGRGRCAGDRLTFNQQHNTPKGPTVNRQILCILLNVISETKIKKKTLWTFLQLVQSPVRRKRGWV